MSKKWSAIRMDDNGGVDDVAITSDTFRLERMDTDRWWACAYRGNRRTSFEIRRKGKEVVVGVQEDSIGCHDDTEEK